MDTLLMNVKKYFAEVGEKHVVFPHSNFINFLPTDIRLDPGFQEFFAWCKVHDIPFIIVSRSVFRKSIAEGDIIINFLVVEWLLLYEQSFQI